MIRSFPSLHLRKLLQGLRIVQREIALHLVHHLHNPNALQLASKILYKINQEATRRLLEELKTTKTEKKSFTKLNDVTWEDTESTTTNSVSIEWKLLSNAMNEESGLEKRLIRIDAMTPNFVMVVSSCLW